ncbi:MAG TPA: RNA-binding protein [Ruminococcaceae bacterium]|nr:RNA-binding protein [Oscillospiraceae bacterium]
MNKFCPEGRLMSTAENLALLRDKSGIMQAYTHGTVLESRVLLCDNNHDLHLDLGAMRGRIPREEGALGIEDGSVRDIALISRVNKPVQFRIIGFESDIYGEQSAVLSRKSVQKDCRKSCISALRPGDVIDATVTHTEGFGAFADIGAGLVALIPIDAVSVSRIPHPNVRFSVGDPIKAVVKSIAPDGKITLTHKELLGTWEENAAKFKAGETVPGIVRSVEKYGVFVELAPNLAGLAEPVADIEPGQHATVYIKSLIPERMKIKLTIVDSFHAQYPTRLPSYFLKEQHIHRWVYSPECCPRLIESVFE